MGSRVVFRFLRRGLRAATGGPASLVHSPTGNSHPVCSRARQPVQTSAGLCVSTDLGRDWQPVLSANPDAKFFPPYLLPADGTYWFGVRTLDFQDRPNPRTLGELAPLLKITLDRQPPTISLRQIADSRPNIVTVEWNVQDENFDPRRFTLEYRVAGTDWQRQPEADGKQTGTQSWQLEPGVRLQGASAGGGSGRQPCRTIDPRRLDVQRSTFGCTGERECVSAPRGGCWRTGWRVLQQKHEDQHWLQVRSPADFRHPGVRPVVHHGQGPTLDQGPANRRRFHRRRRVAAGHARWHRRSRGDRGQIDLHGNGARHVRIHPGRPQRCGHRRPRSAPGRPAEVLGDGGHRLRQKSCSRFSRAKATMCRTSASNGPPRTQTSPTVR